MFSRKFEYILYVHEVVYGALKFAEMAHAIVRDKFHAWMEVMYKLQCAVDPYYVCMWIRGRIYVCRTVRNSSQLITEQEQKPIASWSRAVKNLDLIHTLIYDGK